MPASTAAQWPGVNSQVQYSEGLNVGYRWYDASNVTPLFPFGFGLSYTSFAFSDLHVGALTNGDGHGHRDRAPTPARGRHRRRPALRGRPGRRR